MVRRFRSFAGGATAPYGSDARDDARAIGRMTAIFTIGAGVIHVSAAADHSQLPVMMAGFIAIAMLQVGFGCLLIWRRPSQELAAAGIALAAICVLIWCASRTVGLDVFGIADAEPVGVKDGVAIVFELASIPGLLFFAGPFDASGRLPAPLRRRYAFELVAAFALALYVPALTIEGEHQHASHVALAGHAGPGGHARTGNGGHGAGHGQDDSLHVGHRGGGGSARAAHDASAGGAVHLAAAHAPSGGHAAHSTLAVAGVHEHATTVAGLPVTHDHSAPTIGTGATHTGHPGATGGGHPAGHPGSAGSGGSTGGHYPGHTEPPPAAPAPEQPPTLPAQISDEVDKLVP